MQAIFLDRDGTLIEDQHYPREASRVKLLPSVGEALKLLRSKGYLLFVVSNQSGVGRGLIQDHEFNAVHDRFQALLKEAGAEIAEFAYCFHRPDDECGCRKPKAGMVPKTYQGKELDWKQSVMIGDTLVDLTLADTLGAVGYLVLTGKGPDTLAKLTALGLESRYRIRTSLFEIARELLPAREGKGTGPFQSP
jgi:histidinol-phosphate phosphatase family protein